MKYLNRWLVACLLVFGSVLCAQSDDAVVVIPTEVSEPPYEIGDLVVKQGYYVDRGEDLPQVNLRFEGNKLRLYWIDQDGLIAEPEYSKARVNLKGSVRGRPYHFLAPLPGAEGLGAEGILVAPHLYNVILVLMPDDPSQESVTHTFRYTPDLDVPVDPTAESE